MENEDVLPQLPEQLAVTLTAAEIRALLSIHDYLYANERRSYEEALPEERKTHIFLAVYDLGILLQEMLYDGPC